MAYQEMWQTLTTQALKIEFTSVWTELVFWAEYDKIEIGPKGRVSVFAYRNLEKLLKNTIRSNQQN